MDRGPGEAALAAWVGFLRSHAALVDILERELEEQVGLPLTWYDVLVQLAQAPDGRLRMQELATAIVLSKSGLSRLVDRLETAGYVARVSCPSDRRGTFAELTPSGRRALRRAHPVHLRGVRQHFADHLDAEEIDALRVVMDKLLEGVGGSPGKSGCASTPATAPAR